VCQKSAAVDSVETWALDLTSYKRLHVVGTGTFNHSFAGVHPVDIVHADLIHTFSMHEPVCEAEPCSEHSRGWRTVAIW
jgi:hypothetical protein